METKTCQNCKSDFVIDQEDFNFYEKMQVPAPTFCPMCRAQRRFAFRNERVLFKRKCDFSGKEIFSMYAPDAPVKVYEKNIWLSDEWDPMTYGVDIDFSKPFLSQIKDLMGVVPFKDRNVINGVNSDYSNNATDPKNCYLVFNATNAEDCMYSNGVNHSRDCVDVSHVSKVESCYESFWLADCTKTFFCSQCITSNELWFSRDCRGCQNCFGCVNLSNKSYYIFNQSYTREEYFAKLAEMKLDTRSGIEEAKKVAFDFWQKFPNKNHQGIKNLNCTGSYVGNCKNVKESFLIRESENIKYSQYLQEIPGCKDCYDFTAWGDNAQMVYECSLCGSGVDNLKFGLYLQEHTNDVEYSIACQGSSNLFGCVSLRKKQYCILNKQYTKEEYFALVEKIKKHMMDMPFIDSKGLVYKYGEFFPIEFSNFAYNETIANEYFPLTKEEAVAKGYTWRDPEDKNYTVTMQPNDLPDSINDATDAITKEVIGCSHNGDCNHRCTKAFRITQNELNFYKKNKLPLPQVCPSCRTFERLKFRLGLKLYERKCQCIGTALENGEYINAVKHFHGDDPCINEFKTGFDPVKSDIIYCEKCYQEEVD
ncbi:MAG: hypothetical protein NTZ44_03030 [Candidatus Nomurabacteria bacterium]|nr:hypothetical protein [Candidatus Nomurabacteria bacterium]